MKSPLFTLLVLVFSSNALAQDIDDLSKKELKTALLQSETKRDSIERMAVNLAFEKNQAETILLELKSQLKIANNKLTEVEKSNNSQKEENKKLESELSVCKKRIGSLTDSISKLMVVPTSENNEVVLSVDTRDFLNNYFNNPVPLNNNKFRLELTKIYLGKGEVNRSYGDMPESYFAIGGNRSNDYNNETLDKFNQFLPELISEKDVKVYGVKKNIAFSSLSSAQDAMYEISGSQLKGILPRIEILKNKLVTCTYSNGTEENFLFNVTEGLDNNFRKTLQIDLASEEVKSDGSKNNERDIIWKLYMIDNECYLALTLTQMERLRFPIFEFEKGLKTNYNYLSNRFDRSEDKSTVTTGEGYYVARRKDLYMDKPSFIKPKDAIFLFKFREEK